MDHLRPGKGFSFSGWVGLSVFLVVRENEIDNACCEHRCVSVAWLETERRIDSGLWLI